MKTKIQKSKVQVSVYQEANHYGDGEVVTEPSKFNMNPQINDCGVVINPVVFEVRSKSIKYVAVTIALVDGRFHAGYRSFGSRSPIVPRRCAWHIPDFNPKGCATAEEAAALALKRLQGVPTEWLPVLLPKVAEVFPNQEPDDYKALLDVVSPRVLLPEPEVNSGVPVGAQLALF